jgi:hypothetical protein
VAIRYIDKSSDYWLRVQLDPGPIISVPYGLKVDLIETKANRDHFQILEGNYKGKKASVQLRGTGSYLTDKIKHVAGVLVQFDTKSQALTVGGRGPYNAFSGGGHRGFTPVAPGSYELAIPAYPSAQTRPAYSTWTVYHNLWFRIGIDVNGSRFLHPGAISDGCVTVRQFVYDPASGAAPPAGFGDLVAGATTEPGLIGLPLPAKRAPTVGWDEVVNALILARRNDQAVGQLVVT